MAQYMVAPDTRGLDEAGVLALFNDESRTLTAIQTASVPGVVVLRDFKKPYNIVLVESPPEAVPELERRLGKSFIVEPNRLFRFI